ncbi:hypothetical protein [Aureivirga marina]|uniref:hypothetical protein n=1 Tax=Aureivirga marina TaxID=1182451 RepID=UPI0018CA6032|nr:hypothetical protein [Aureivirga marina]
MKKLIVLSLVSGFLLTSCGTMGVVSTPTNYTNAGKEVSVVKKKTNIFGLTPMDTHSETTSALQELNGKCTDGITNVTSTVSSKIFIVGFEKLEVKANCK